MTLKYLSCIRIWDPLRSLSVPLDPRLPSVGLGESPPPSYNAPHSLLCRNLPLPHGVRVGPCSPSRDGGMPTAVGLVMLQPLPQRLLLLPLPALGILSSLLGGLCWGPDL